MLQAGQDQTAWGVGTAYTWVPHIGDSNPVEVVLAADLTMFSRDSSTNGATASDDGWTSILYSAVEF